MVNIKDQPLELSPSLRERLRKALLPISGLIIGISTLMGTLLFVDNDMVMFAAIFIGALFIFFSLYRILKIASLRLHIDEEMIKYRERFIWKRVSWSEVISVGRANIKGKDGFLKKIKSLLIMTNKGLLSFDLSVYSLTHGMEIVDKIVEAQPKSERLPLDEQPILPEEEKEKV